ncbi:retrovirus-related Pol polyprotein from transposon 412 [Paramisgurnus dabryanus]|uniref:retrovirus-related Pol polyprotein from transposon 412 n=1 Tax=Paramisgurnus dabryanus TaxID=90735 RepID=UPI003CCF28AE
MNLRQPMLPRGLIGARCTTQVNIAGVTCDCLLDTGSQVTTITQSFYNKNLSDQQIHSLGNLLEVESANGQNVPYLGYVELTITFPKEFVGVNMDVPTLALVIPDLPSAFQPSVLIGTNTLDELYKDFSHQKPLYFSPSFGYKQVLKILELRQNQAVEGNVGLVRLPEKQPQVIPAGQSAVLCGTASVQRVYPDKWVVVEHPTFSSLPGGLIVKTCIATLGEFNPCYLPVVISNPTAHDITIPSRCIVAELKAVQSVNPSKQSASEVDTEPTLKSSLEFNFGDSSIPPEWKDRLTSRLREMPEVFSLHSQDFGCTDKVKHKINLTDETPFKHRARPIHPEDMEAVKKHLQELLDAGVIRESVSPYSSPIVVVKKKSGDVRLCIDYRKLNQRTIKDAYALPKLEDTFMALTGSKWFSVLDLKSGFYQIEVEEKDKAKTAFVCPLGFYEFNRMPQGVTNAPSTFQRIMEKCMADINLCEVLVFIDDIIVFSKDLDEHEERLFRVLNRLKEYGLKLAPEKCIFAQSSVRYLGHIVSDKGVQTDPDKVAAVKTWPVPRNLKELRSFLGFVGYYRRFVKDFSKKVKPLNDLTSGYPPARRDTKPNKSGQYWNPKDSFSSRWTTTCQRAFDQIIEELTTAPVLAFANPKLPYVLHTDASTSGLGAALYQEQDGQMRVVAYASRGLSSSESKYPAHKLEFLALKWAVTEKFHDFLYGSTFTVVTDSNPLTYVLSTAKLDAAGYRWLAALSTYDFKLQYRCGRQNIDADGLSRRPHTNLSVDDASHNEQNQILTFVERLTEEAGERKISSEVVRAICDSRLTQQSEYVHDLPVTFISSLTMQTAAVPDDYSQEDHCGGLPSIPHLSSLEIQRAQLADPCIREVITQIQTGESPSRTVRDALPRLPYLLREKERLEFHDGVLYRRRSVADKTTYQLVLPEEFHSDVLKYLHDDLGHMGIDRTLELVRNRFYWPKMASDIEYKIRTCGRCIRRKVLPEKAAPLVNITTNRPLQLVCMDFLTLEPDRSNTKDVLVITDHFTKYALAIPTPNQKAKTVAKCLWEQFICYYGYPERLHSDQGPDFESQLIKELCDIAGVRKVRTTPYHPRGNPVERFNRTLLNMLGTLEAKKKSCWKEFVKPLVHAYNCTRNETTGFSPYELMFGRQPRLPVDLAFGLPIKGKMDVTHSQYVKNLKSNLKESFRIAVENSKKMAGKK